MWLFRNASVIQRCFHDCDRLLWIWEKNPKPSSRCKGKHATRSFRVGIRLSLLHSQKGYLGPEKQRITGISDSSDTSCLASYALCIYRKPNIQPPCITDNVYLPTKRPSVSQLGAHLCAPTHVRARTFSSSPSLQTSQMAAQNNPQQTSKQTNTP